MVAKRQPRPRPETLAMARRGTARPPSWSSLCWDMPIEDELCLTRVIAQRLLAALQAREPAYADYLLTECLSAAGRAAVDLTFEAMLLLLDRHHIDVVPCRRLLESQDRAPDRFVLTRPSGDTEVVDRDRLLMLAGLEDTTPRQARDGIDPYAG